LGDLPLKKSECWDKSNASGDTQAKHVSPEDGPRPTDNPRIPLVILIYRALLNFWRRFCLSSPMLADAFLQVFRDKIRYTLRSLGSPLYRVDPHALQSAIREVAAHVSTEPHTFAQRSCSCGIAIDDDLILIITQFLAAFLDVSDSLLRAIEQVRVARFHPFGRKYDENTRVVQSNTIQ
jgi:hypothetical protein